jgi:hypothetical protein
MVELIFNVKHDGTPAKNVDLSYRVYAPPKNFWFGTDFPVVEGTQLLSGTVRVPTGSQVVSMILPIRGDYKVKTTVRGPEGVSHSTQSFSVSENPQEIINLSIFLGVLFLIGGIGGYFLRGNTGSTSPGSVLLLFALVGGVVLFATPEAGYAHGQGSWDPHELEAQRGTMTIKDGTKISVKTFPTPVSVGEMLNVRYRVQATESTGHGEGHADQETAQSHETDHSHGEKGHGYQVSSGDLLAESHFVHSAGGLEMANQTVRLKQGRGSINVQLFDGAPHYLVTRFYRPTTLYGPSGIHAHGHNGGHDKDNPGESGEERQREGHAHAGSSAQEPSWEAEVRYQLEPGDYSLIFEQSGDPAMKWLLLPEGTDHPRETAHQRMNDCKSVRPTRHIEANARCYNLQLNDTGTMYQISVAEAGDYVMFTQHLPREFDLTLQRNGTVIAPQQKFIKGKGEYLGRNVELIEINAVQPPFDDIFKSMVTLLGVVAIGFLIGYRGPEWLGN